MNPTITQETIYSISHEGYTASMTKPQIIEKVSRLIDDMAKIESDISAIDDGKVEITTLKAKPVKTDEDKLSITRLYSLLSKEAILGKKKQVLEREIGILSQVLSSID